MNKKTIIVFSLLGGIFLLMAVGLFMGISKKQSSQKTTALQAQLKDKNPLNNVIGSTAEMECVRAGCSGQLCLDKQKEGQITTCEYQSQYACYKNAKCEKQTDGSCGFTQTPELETCLKTESGKKSIRNIY